MKAQRDILIVDDEPGYMYLVNKKLRSAGYHVVPAQNAEEALAALWERPIGLVLLDVRLPVINGLHIYEIIRKDFPDKKIIVSSVLHKDEQRFLLDDADDFYDKSDDFSSLVMKVDNIFNSRTEIPPVNRNEKRSARRVPVNVLASCEKGRHRVPSENYSHFISYTKDLSFYGGKFVVGEQIKPGQHLTVSLELPVNVFPLLIDCEVVWVKKEEGTTAGSKENVEAGFRFVKLYSAHDEEKLKSYLNCV